MAGSKSCSEQGGVEAVKDADSREECNLEWTLQMMATDLRRPAATLCTKHAWPSATWSAPLMG